MKNYCPVCDCELKPDDEIYYAVDKTTRRRICIGCEFCTERGYADDVFDFDDEDEYEYIAADLYNDLIKEERAIGIE